MTPDERNIRPFDAEGPAGGPPRERDIVSLRARILTHGMYCCEKYRNESECPAPRQGKGFIAIRRSSYRHDV